MFRGEIKAVGDLASGSSIAYILKVTFMASLKENGKW